MPVTIRTARASDADDVARLTAQLGYDSEVSSLEARLSRILSRSDQRFVVAAAGDRIVGWLHAYVAEIIELEPFFVIAGLVVDHDHRRQGIGALLVRHAEEWAQTRGCSVGRLWSSVGRTGAHEFYRRLGYAQIKTQHSFAKALNAHGVADLEQLVPKVRE